MTARLSPCAPTGIKTGRTWISSPVSPKTEAKTSRAGRRTRFIYEERNAAASGREALGTDASAEAARAEDLACERYVLDSGKLQAEVLQNLDKAAPAGALLFVAWPRIQYAAGLPVRAAAITPKQ